ncbi:oligosaccharide flippase family protein [Clostridium sp. YIM B02505]|uniref:Oligosaccharide flippase family protein n=1 Tax=Clostridium yunnanense TaxID=2800325 RepID=A0ABS1EWY0_9CLOT|nr:oligosaccharide flippase family protein [Clostridium yunnanense]MBK1813882.1 oligosaccharide flippase family protein [Clostridium yunnanense]
MSIIKNYIYNTLYQVMIMIIPLITIPYLTRIFSPGQMGLNAYSLSIVNYFMLFGMLGMQMYGNRQVGYIRDDKEKLRRYFWSLYSTQICTSLIAMVAYYIFVGIFMKENQFIFLIQGLNMLMVVFDISWLFMGLEDFKKVVIRNSTAKLVGLVSIFVFVRSSDDLIKYILLTIFINLAGLLIMWTNIPKSIRKIEIDMKIIKETIFPLIRLFLPQISTQVYLLLSRTLIGALSDNDQVAYYDYSQKIINIILSLVASVGVILLPRISNILGQGKKEEMKKLVEQTFSFVSYVSIPMAFGLMGISKILVSWFLDPQYYAVERLTVASSIIIVAVNWANIIGIQYLVGSKQENKYTISIVISGVINLIMNIILIPRYGATGAVISIIEAEVLGIILQLIFVRKQLPVVKMLLGTGRYWIVSIIMMFLVSYVGGFIANPVLANVVQVVTGGVFYLLVMFILKDKTQELVISKAKGIIMRR